MPNAPIIHIQTLEQSTFQWFDGSTIQMDPLSTILKKIQVHEVSILLSGQHVFLSYVDIPTSNMNQFQKAAPFSLEEELAEDIEQLHFAYGPFEKNKPVAVAAINKKFLLNCLNLLEAAGLEPQNCYIDYLALPMVEEHWTAVVTEEHSYVKITELSGFSTPTNQLEMIFKLHFDIAKAKPPLIDVFDLRHKNQHTQINLAHIPTKLHKTKACNLLDFLFENPAKIDYGINLLQGSFKASKKFTPAKKAWLAVVGCAIAWIIINFIGTLGSYFYYEHQQAKLHQKIDNIYMQVFPNATAIVSPKIRMERELQKYQRFNSDNAFLSILTKIGPILKTATQVTLQHMGFQNNKMTLSIQTNSFKILQQFATNLRGTGQHVQQIHAGTKDKKIVASFAIRSQS